MALDALPALFVAVVIAQREWMRRRLLADERRLSFALKRPTTASGTCTWRALFLSRRPTDPRLCAREAVLSTTDAAAGAQRRPRQLRPRLPQARERLQGFLRGRIPYPPQERRMDLAAGARQGGGARRGAQGGPHRRHDDRHHAPQETRRRTGARGGPRPADGDRQPRLVRRRAGAGARTLAAVPRALRCC